MLSAHIDGIGEELSALYLSLRWLLDHTSFKRQASSSVSQLSSLDQLFMPDHFRGRIDIPPMTVLVPPLNFEKCEVLHMLEYFHGVISLNLRGHQYALVTPRQACTSIYEYLWDHASVTDAEKNIVGTNLQHQLPDRVGFRFVNFVGLWAKPWRRPSPCASITTKIWRLGWWREGQLAWEMLYKIIRQCFGEWHYKWMTLSALELIKVMYLLTLHILIVDPSNQRSGWSSLVVTQPSTGHQLFCVQCVSVCVCVCVYCFVWYLL